MLDVGELTTLEIDPGGRTAWAGAGLTARAYTEAAHAWCSWSMNGIGGAGIAAAITESSSGAASASAANTSIVSDVAGSSSIPGSS